MQFTDDQNGAIEYIKDFIACSFDDTCPDTYLCTLSGSAGTGKTTLTKMVVRMVRRSGKQILCVAPTHKARKVLDAIINTSSFLRIPTTTVAGLLGKMRAHGYVGTQNYKKGLDTKVGMYDFFIVDEISMVTTSDYREITNLARLHGKKVLFVGDHLQIPNPSQKYEMQHGCLIKAINPAFHEPHQLQLRTVVRTDSDNPLMKLLERARDLVGTGFSIKDLVPADLKQGLIMGSTVQDNKGFMLIPDHTTFLETVKASSVLFRTGDYRIICYTNNSVKQYNKLVRSSLGYNDHVVIGELLMGYQNVGPNNDLIIENGQDYFVTKINETRQHSVSANGKQYDNLCGKAIGIQERISTTGTGIEACIFMLDLEEPDNSEVLEELVYLANKVNSRGSTKLDYRSYITLKTQLVFMEDLYQYKGHIYTGTEFKTMHPLLFTQTTAVLTARGDTIASELSTKISEMYPDLLTGRLQDTGSKEISRSEVFADMYQVLERDISYGYALTAHKSQGSTYHSVYIDEPDFNALSDRWSWQHKMDIKRSRERDQLKYVALSRPSNVCYVHIP